MSFSPESNMGKPETPCKVSHGDRGTGRFRTPSILVVDTIPSHPIPLVLTRARFWFRGQKCGNTGSPCLDKPVLGRGGGGVMLAPVDLIVDSHGYPP